jgi:cell division protein FtsN
MPYSPAVNSTRRARWPIVVLVVGAVASASLALGLMVVGPMIQRHMETPPPVLAISGTSAVTPARPAVSAADVEIKERIVRRPAPRPVLPRPDELNVDLGSTPVSTDTTAALAEGRSSSARPKPSIKATVTDAAGDLTGQPADPATATDQGTRESHRLPRRPEAAASPDEGARAGQADASGQPRPRSTTVPRAGSRRAAPLDALPALDPNGPGSRAARELPTASPAPDPDVRTAGKNYRVQVGRFSDQQQAEKLRDELSQSGLSPRIVKSQKGGTTVYRVQIGTYKQKENADRQIEMLKSRSYEPYLADDEP